MFDVREEFSAPDNIELRIVEDKSTDIIKNTQLPSISSLTAEIETLVKSVEEDTENLVKQVNSETKNKQNPVEAKVEIPVKVAETQINKTEIDETIINDKSQEIKEVEVNLIVTEENSLMTAYPIEKVVIKETTTKIKPQDVQVIKVTTISESPASPETINSDEKVVLSSGYDTDNDESELSQTSLSINTSNYLKIVEEYDSTSNDSHNRATLTSYEIKYRPLNDVKTKSERAFEQRKREKERDAWRAELCRSNSSGDEVTIRTNEADGSRYHGERRRSVKEIIEAINKNQSLLQGTNYSPLNGKYDYNEHPNLKAQREKEPPQTSLELQLEAEVQNNERCYSYYDNVPDMLQNLDKQSQGFEKCDIQPQRRPSFEWNPVPKPARKSQNYSESNNLNNVD